MQIEPVTIELISAILSSLLTAALVLLYWRQSDIQDKQREIMATQAELQKANLRSFAEISKVTPNEAPVDALSFSVENKGNSNITDLHCWLHLEDSTAEFESLSSKLSEQTDLDLHQSPIPVEKQNSDWPESGDLYSVVIEPGEKVNLRTSLMLHNEDGLSISISEILESASQLEELDHFAVHLSLLYTDATGERKSERIFGVASFGPPKHFTLTTMLKNMQQGFVLEKDRAVSEYHKWEDSTS
ncbi:hypothetical protein [Haloarcula argentinensis]|uniref:Uncharacterized protein n=1 Tax=Haloarcula argentinensis TaxID=43776 RepID=A0A830FSI2_HALAR|nr:hypothetical protein [Haloarcula argentinensis]GGM26876.1 hypothetical protein GCM10009006_05450 [Haloarcula argentinensis]